MTAGRVGERLNRCPTDAEFELAQFGDENDLVELQIASGTVAALAAGSSQAFVSWKRAGPKEGIVIGLSFWTPTGDYLTNPVSIGRAGVSQLKTNPALQVEAVDTFNCQVGARGQPLMFGGKRGYRFGKDRTPVLSITNGSAVPLMAEGYLVLLVWNPENRANATKLVQAWQAKTQGVSERVMS